MVSDGTGLGVSGIGFAVEPGFEGGLAGSFQQALILPERFIFHYCKVKIFCKTEKIIKL